ncbi:MAG: hypothetical protein AB7E76_10745 [Deferribacterales bacterium]
MANLTYANFALSKLTQALSASGTAVHIADDALFPDGYFTAVIWSAGVGSPLEDADSELLTLMRTSAGVFEAVRGDEGTTARDWAQDSLIANVVTAETMEYIYSAAGNTASVTVMSDTAYTMERDDTKMLCTFTPAEGEKSVTLPASDVCEGLTYTILNRGIYPHQTLKLYPNASDGYAHTAEGYISIPSGGSAQLIHSDDGWVVISANADSYKNLRIIDEDMPSVSFGEGTLYADTSAEDINITLPSAKEYCGVPLKIYKFSDDANKVIISGYEGDSTPVELTEQWQSAVFVMSQSGTVYMTDGPQASAPSSGTSEGDVIFLSENRFLDGSERFIFVTTGSVGIHSYLPEPSAHTGKMVTVKKIDSGSGVAIIFPIDSTIDGAADLVELTQQWQYATFACGGDGWYRVG